MELTFLTPLGALLVVVAILPLAVLRAREHRLRRLRRVLSLQEPRRSSRLGLAGAVAGACGLLALAAAQPVVATTRELRERTDAQVFVVLDTSRSMLAAEKPGAPSRFERARGIARDLADRLPDVPMGIASMTDGLLPHLFPTTDRRVFRATLEQTMRVQAVPASSFYSSGPATSLDALVAAPTLNYFPPAAKNRALVVLTDGESRPLEQDLARAFGRGRKIDVVFVHVWSGSERVYTSGVAEFGYKPDSKSAAALARIASLVRGRVLSEDESGGLYLAVSRLLGTGPTRQREHEGNRLALMPWITLAAALPLGLVLRRRNL